MKLLNIFLVSLCLLCAFSFVSAEEATVVEEEVTAQDLNVAEPTILPDSPFYFLKNISREIQSIFTFDQVKKAELRERFTNEKLIELKKVAEKTENVEVIKKATENYRKEAAKFKEVVENIEKTAEESEDVSNFLDKFIQQQTLQQTVLQKLASQVPAEVLEKITEAREAHLERFGEVMNKLENKEKIQERLQNNLEQAEGNEFQNFKTLEILDALEEKSPQEIKEAVQGVSANILTKLKEKIESMTSEEMGRFQDYTENLSGLKEKQMEIIENLKSELQDQPQIIQKLLQTREKMIEQVQEGFGEENTAVSCPQISKPAATFCPNGRIVIKKDDQGCIASFDCIVPAETSATPKTSPENQACITLWDPVCGKDGKTYSNKCYASAAGTEAEYRGTCSSEGQSTNAACKSMWWYDSNSSYCQQKQFCGLYMYLGLQTFGTKEECETSLGKTE